MIFPRSRPRVLRGPSGGEGSIQIADDRSKEGCYICGSRTKLRFLQFNSPRLGDRMFLRLCAACLSVVAFEEQALRAQEDTGADNLDLQQTG